MKKSILFLLSILLIFGLCSCGSATVYSVPVLNTSSNETVEPTVGNSKNVSGTVDGYMFTEIEQESDFVKIELSDGQVMIIKLEPTEAPITVANFKKLVSNKFYDSLTFHRIIKNFMVQGGDPKGNGTGGSGENIKGEFDLNGVANNIKHVRGTISMARGAYDYDSASSQFFIVTATSENNTRSLDGQYAAFGNLIAGWQTLDNLNVVSVNGDSPIKKPVINTVRFVEVTEVATVPTESTPEVSSETTSDSGANEGTVQ